MNAGADFNWTVTCSRRNIWCQCMTMACMAASVYAHLRRMWMGMASERNAATQKPGYLHRRASQIENKNLPALGANDQHTQRILQEKALEYLGSSSTSAFDSKRPSKAKSRREEAAAGGTRQQRMANARCKKCLLLSRWCCATCLITLTSSSYTPHNQTPSYTYLLSHHLPCPSSALPCTLQRLGE